MKLGLIAMSGVRAANPELTKIGLTLPGFVERSQVIASLPSLSLLTLAGLTPPDVEVEYREIRDLEAEPERPRDYDLVAIASYSAQIKDAYRVADLYRERGVPVVLGGLHVSMLPGEASAHGATVVVGEAEPLWPLVIEDFRAGRLAAEYRSSEGSWFDLADAPMPRFDLLDPERYNRITVQTSRGCPHRCDFCASSILLTPKYAVKPVAKVLA
ncbi:MAG: cobalamin-dependent protein, partial [Candidatus Eisenbacteria bacterium]